MTIYFNIKKQREEEVIQWKGDNFHEVMSFCVVEKTKLTQIRKSEEPKELILSMRLDYDVIVDQKIKVGDYIIKNYTRDDKQVFFHSWNELTFGKIYELIK